MIVACVFDQHAFANYEVLHACSFRSMCRSWVDESRTMPGGAWWTGVKSASVGVSLRYSSRPEPGFCSVLAYSMSLATASAFSALRASSR